LTFAGALITNNTIDMTVNGTPLSTITFASNDTTTLGLIATALQALDTIVTASAGTHNVTIVPVAGNDTVVITDIGVLLGSTQTTGTVADSVFAATDEGKFYDITTAGQYVNIPSAHASSNQLKMEKFLSVSEAAFSIANT
jgi:hypothetical protein